MAHRGNGDALPPDVVEPLSPAAVGRWLGANEKTLANWRCAGSGPPYLKVGGLVRYRRGDVDTWIAEQVVAR